jgi:hypothetical protein
MKDKFTDYVRRNYNLSLGNTLICLHQLDVEKAVKRAKAEVLKEVEQEFSDLILCNDNDLRESIQKTFNNLILELKKKHLGDD